MTNEAVKVELTNSTGFPRRYACASGAAITKGTLLKLTDPRTAAAADATGAAAAVPCAGIAAMDKSITNDDSNTITAWTDGVFECIASGAITLGLPISFLVNNQVCQSAVGASGAIIAGYALEAADHAETINVRVRL